MVKKVIPLLVAGGRGSRVWPLSREKRPKQFLSIDGGEPLLKRCFDRATALAEASVPYVIACADQLEQVRLVLGEEGETYRFIPEPLGRNTAAALAWGCRVIKEREGDGVVVALPADHLISDAEGFQKTLSRAVAVAEKENALTVIGITPRYPATGFGYAEWGKKETIAGEPYYKVKRFVEKPHREKARRYLKKGTYAWNSGIIVSPLAVLKEVMAYHLPEISSLLDEVAIGDTEALQRAYETIEPKSFDAAVLEKERDVFIVEADFDWNDVGSYHQLSSLIPPDGAGNVRRGNHLFSNVRDSVVITDNRLTAVIGVRDLVIIEDQGVLLVCPRRRVEEIKGLVENLTAENRIFR